MLGDQTEEAYYKYGLMRVLYAVDFKFYVMEEILIGNGSLESGNMKDLTFCEVKVHLSI